MQAAAAAAVCFTPSILTIRSTKSLVPSSAKPHRAFIIRSTAAEKSTFDYSSTVSVFPMEACDILGGEACDTKMFPEVKLAASDKNTAGSSVASEEIERDYLEYDDSKTVFPGEACDDLGGEFCEAEYQSGVY
ncbi:light-regulated protein, chloroplastic-like [Zingiber officinale]|uniref:light-regulated protein, chloroplastic-like n=1 Tax=Zingiber officinale TaxID=94328 RepID=UPI001C4CF500|nr:light-regulated protein, chloroplastic-like [Zingiber officinale]